MTVNQHDTITTINTDKPERKRLKLSKFNDCQNYMYHRLNDLLPEFTSHRVEPVGWHWQGPGRDWYCSECYLGGNCFRWVEDISLWGVVDGPLFKYLEACPYSVYYMEYESEAYSLILPPIGSPPISIPLDIIVWERVRYKEVSGVIIPIWVLKSQDMKFNGQKPKGRLFEYLKYLGLWGD